MSKSFVLDCSVAMAWSFKEEQCHYSTSVLNMLENSVAVVPFLWDLEITNTVINGERRKKTNHNNTFVFLEFLNTLNITRSLFMPSREELVIASRSYDLTSYDALYLMLAMHEKLPLATKDKALIMACDIVGVELLR